MVLIARFLIEAEISGLKKAPLMMKHIALKIIPDIFKISMTYRNYETFLRKLISCINTIDI